MGHCCFISRVAVVMAVPHVFSGERIYIVGDVDVKLGEISGVPFYMSQSQFAYWEHTHLVIDAVPGTGGMFSLERPTGLKISHPFTAIHRRRTGCTAKSLTD